MDPLKLKALSSAHHIDPNYVLPRLEALRSVLARSNTTAVVANLRTNSLKRSRELWHASILAQGISQQSGDQVYVLDDEAEDHDVVLCQLHKNTAHYVPVQLKEVVPYSERKSQSAQEIIDAIRTKGRYAETCVAIKLTAPSHFNPFELDLNNLAISSLYIFGSTLSDQSKWAIWGDLFLTRYGIEFEVPRFRVG